MRFALAIFLAVAAMADELPGEGRITQIIGSPELLAMNGQMMGILAPKVITMIDLRTAHEACLIEVGLNYTPASGGEAVVTHREATGLLQVWHPETGEEIQRISLGNDARELAMGVNNDRYIAMLWREDKSQTIAGILDRESGKTHLLDDVDFAAILGLDPDARHLFIRRGRNEIYRVDLPRPLPDSLPAEPLVSGDADGWAIGNTLLIDDHLIDFSRRLLAYRPAHGAFIPSIAPDRYAWFDRDARQLELRQLDGTPLVTVQLGVGSRVALLTADRLVMRQRNQQRIYPLTRASQEARYLRPGQLWAGRLHCGREAKVEIIDGPPGLAVDLQCHALTWTVSEAFDRQPIRVELRITEDGESHKDIREIAPRREHAIADVMRYLWLRLHYDVRADHASAVDARLATLQPLLVHAQAVPIPISHLAKNPLGDRVRLALAPHFLKTDPLRANLLLADAALRAKDPAAGRHLLAALAARPIAKEHDTVVRQAMTHFSDTRPLPAEFAEFASALHTKLVDVDSRLENRYHELRKWLWERSPKQ